MVKSILAPFGKTAAASEVDAGIQKKIHYSGITTLISSNEEMNVLMKIVQTHENSDILLKRSLKQLKMRQKKKKGGFCSMFLGTLGAILLGYSISAKRVVRAVLEIKKENEL